MYVLTETEKAQILENGPQLLIENKLLLKVVGEYIEKYDNVNLGNDDLEYAQNVIAILSKGF